MGKAKRFSENKKDFPDSRENMKEDAKFLIAFFTESNWEDEQVTLRYEELLKLNPAKPEADCIKQNIAIQELSTK